MEEESFLDQASDVMDEDDDDDDDDGIDDECLTSSMYFHTKESNLILSVSRIKLLTNKP